MTKAAPTEEATASIGEGGCRITPVGEAARFAHVITEC